MRRLVALLRSPVVHDVWVLAAMLLALGAAVIAVRTVERLDDEIEVRLDQSCRQQEASFVEAVDDVRERYRYLLGFNPAELRAIKRQDPDADNTGRFVFADLDNVEQEARASRPLPFCNMPGRGRPTDELPRIPERPRELR